MTLYPGPQRQNLHPQSYRGAVFLLQGMVEMTGSQFLRVEELFLPQCPPCFIYKIDVIRQQFLNHRVTEKKNVLFDACTSVSTDASASLSSPCSLQVSQPHPHQLPLASLLVLLLHLHLELCSSQLILSIFLGHESLFVN